MFNLSGFLCLGRPASTSSWNFTDAMVGQSACNQNKETASGYVCLDIIYLLNLYAAHSTQRSAYTVLLAGAQYMPTSG